MKDPTGSPFTLEVLTMRVTRRLTHADIRAMRSAAPAPDDPYLSNAAPTHIPYKRVFEEHDAQTRALIHQYEALAAFPHSGTVVESLEHWRWLDCMAGPADKQRFLEPLIADVQRDPVANEDKLIFLLIVCEPVRRGVSKEFIRARSGLESPAGPSSWHRREEARRLAEVEKQSLYDVTRAATLDALFGYPTPGPDRLFPWLRATIAHGALDHLAKELPELQTSRHSAAEAAAVQRALCGLQEFEAPAMREAPNRDSWRARIDLRGVFEVTEAYFEHSTVRRICGQAVGRLPVRQREVIEALFFDGEQPDELARRRSVSRSTVYNHKRQALGNLYDDDVFFTGLAALGRVRDRVRAKGLAERYPDGRLPDGRRIVFIGHAA